MASILKTAIDLSQAEPEITFDPYPLGLGCSGVSLRPIGAAEKSKSSASQHRRRLSSGWQARAAKRGAWLGL